jgi:tetratricopeptide (TPR) repeat protein
MVHARGILGRALSQLNDHAAARALFEENLAASWELGARGGVAVAWNDLADVAYRQGDYAAARASYLESLALCRELGQMDSVAVTLGSLGRVAFHQKDYPAAQRFYAESLKIYAEIPDEQGVAQCLLHLADLAVASGEMERAARLLGAAAARSASGQESSPPVTAVVRAALGNSVFAAAWAAGQAMALKQAVEYAVQE